LSTGLAIHGSAFDRPKQCFGYFRLTLLFCVEPVFSFSAGTLLIKERLRQGR
jgi:hypothetical protein